MWSFLRLESWVQDAGYAIRLLLRQRVWSATAIVTLALGIAGTISAFTFMNIFLLRPLPFPDPDRLVHVWGTTEKARAARGRISVPDFIDLRRDATLVEDLAAFNYTEEDLTGGTTPERVFVGRVTANAFDLLGVKAAIGRTLSRDADVPGAPAEAVLAHGFWTTHFAADPNVAGRTLRLNGEVHTIAGVMPSSFLFPLPVTQVWAPRAIDPAAARSRRTLQVFGRLKPGVTRDRADAEIAAVAGRIAARHPVDNAGISARVVPLWDGLNFAADILRPMVAILASAVVLVFLVVCANLATLMLSRGVARGREMAVRAALGAGRLRLVRQVVTESLVLAVCGGAGGVLLASWNLARVKGAIPPDLYRVGDLTIDGAALAFTVAMSTIAVLLFGLAPAVLTTGVDPGAGLKSGGGQGAARGRRTWQRMLVVGQLAIGTVLLVAAVLMIGSVRALRHAPLGFEPDQVLTLKVILPERRYPTLEQVAAFHRDAAARVAALPAVAAAATVDYLPLNHETVSLEVFRAGATPADGEGTRVNVLTVGGNYFTALGVPVLRGTGLERSSGAAATGAAVVSRALASRLFGDADAVGRQFITRVRGGTSRTYTIAGVVGDTRHRGLKDEPDLQVYVPQEQTPTRYLRLLLRSGDGTPVARHAAAVRDAVRQIDPELPVTEVRTLREVVDEFLLPESNIGNALAEQSVTAAILALVGIYGVLAFSVAVRTREIGIRMALGASRREVLRLFLGQAARLSGTGVLLGLVGAYGLTRFLSAFLFSVSADDPRVFAGVAALLFACSLAACYVPARRAAAIDPIGTLRAE